jgi:hypothetical protein
MSKQPLDGLMPAMLQAILATQRRTSLARRWDRCSDGCADVRERCGQVVLQRRQRLDEVVKRF